MACRTIGGQSDIKRQLLASLPNDRYRILSLAEQLAMLATVERHGGDSASARRDYAEAAALLEPIDLGAGDSEVQVLRAGYLIGEAVAAADHGPIDQALPTLQKAVAILTRFVATAKDDPRPRQRLTEALWQRARLLRPRPAIPPRRSGSTPSTLPAPEGPAAS